MASPAESMSAHRLCEAAEAALRAAADVAEYTKGPWPYPADLMGSPMQPDFLGEFTKWEMERACEFLVRMGLIEPRRRK